MAKTYHWSDFVTAASALLKGVGQFTSQAVQYCDIVSSDMYLEYPWKDTITTTQTAPGLTPLLDGLQDYSPAGANVFRLLNAAIWDVTSSPATVRDLNVVAQLAVNLFPQSYTTIRDISLQQGVGLLRLESAVNVPQGTLLEVRYDYQINPTKITSITQTCWFEDRYAQVAIEGLTYWGYKLSDDPRAGMAQTDATGRVIAYSGQLATYKASLFRMKSAEDYGKTEIIFPDAGMGEGRDQNSLNIFGN